MLTEDRVDNDEHASLDLNNRSRFDWSATCFLVAKAVVLVADTKQWLFPLESIMPNDDAELETIIELFFDDMQVQMLMQLMLLTIGCCLFLPEKRNPPLFQQRCCWDNCAELHDRRGSLKRRIRMSHESFDKLLALTCDDSLVREALAKPRGGAVIPELRLFCTLRWLASGSHLDICDIAGTSTASFCRILWKTMTGICKCDALDIVWPTTKAQLRSAMDGFRSIGHEQAIANCIGVVDGHLMRIRVPTRMSAA